MFLKLTPPANHTDKTQFLINFAHVDTVYEDDMGKGSVIHIHDGGVYHVAETVDEIYRALVGDTPLTDS